MTNSITARSEDLLSRIQRERGCSRGAARRILTDLIDHHRRLRLSGRVRRDMKLPGGTIVRSTVVTRAFRAPISSISTDPYLETINGPLVSRPEPNPHSRVRPDDLLASRQRKIKAKGNYQVSKTIEITYLGTELALDKGDFIITCLEHRESVAYIANFLLPFIPFKPEETERDHYVRVYGQVYMKRRVWLNGRKPPA